MSNKYFFIGMFSKKTVSETNTKINYKELVKKINQEPGLRMIDSETIEISISKARQLYNKSEVATVTIPRLLEQGFTKDELAESFMPVAEEKHYAKIVRDSKKVIGLSQDVEQNIHIVAELTKDIFDAEIDVCSFDGYPFYSNLDKKSFKSFQQQGYEC